MSISHQATGSSACINGYGGPPWNSRSPVMEILKLGGFASAIRRVFQKLSDSNVFPGNPCAKAVFDSDPQLCFTGGGNNSWNGSGSNGDGGGYNNQNDRGGDNSGHRSSGLLLLGMQALFQDAGYGDTALNNQDDEYRGEGRHLNKASSIDGPCEMELVALQQVEKNLYAPLENPRSIQRNGFNEIALYSVAAAGRLLQGVMGLFEQLSGRPAFAKAVANHESTSKAEQMEKQEARVASSDGATTAPKMDHETAGKPLGPKQSDIDTLKRLQREAFFELIKLREKLEKLEQVAQPHQKQERLGAARSHLKGEVRAGTAFVGLQEENIKHSRDSLELAGMQTGLDVRFTFETPFRESDVLITQIVSGQSSSMGGERALGGPLRLGKLHYVAHINDDVSLSILPFGAQGQDVTEIINVLQDQGPTSFSSQGPALFSHCKGSALGTTVSGSKFAFSLAQYLSGWGNHVSAMESVTEEDPLCYSTLCQLLLQPTEGFILSFCGLNQYWPTPPLPSSMASHWSEMGPFIFPRIKAKEPKFFSKFSTTHMDVSTGSELLPHWEAPDIESGPATFQNKGTGLLSLAISSSVDVGENMSLSGWAQVERGELLQDPDKGNFQWTMSLATTSGTGIDWGASVGGSRHDMWRMPSSSYNDYSGEDNVSQLHVEAFLKFSCGKGFTLQPGLLYVSNKSSYTPAIIVRSSWSL
ncbi:hypothetical protein GOP47_0019691 [Adiantum capillus-veneris]|uniref:Uncharacterized protein n=1 Tax=Adiantum capillus-veneris TaxID=13818 RepID=A0A9D4UD84_ADICA|nr:hypothetical protein GOP47_0019691 [Adiantum capillus-veneris]